MLSCLGYKNQVMPLPQLSGTLSDYSHIKNTAIVLMEGMGSTSPDGCKNDTRDNVFYHRVNYSSLGLLKDFKVLNKEAKALKNKKETSSIFSKTRIYKLKNIVKSYVVRDNINTVIIIGMSHGSLIVHAAYLKLMIDLQLTHLHLAKIKIITIGSPRYLPTSLTIGQNNKVLNFYHQKDSITKVLYTFTGKDSKFMVPNLPYVNGAFLEEPKSNGKPYESADFKWTSPLYFYDEPNGIVYVNKCNMPERPLLESKYFNNFYIPSPPDTLLLHGAILFHTKIYMLYPIFSDFSIMHTSYMDKYLSKDVVKCPLIGGNVIMKCYITILSTKKRYLVRMQDTKNYILLSKNKIFLSQIRGKYRYCA